MEWNSVWPPDTKDKEKRNPSRDPAGEARVGVWRPRVSPSGVSHIHQGLISPLVFCSSTPVSDGEERAVISFPFPLDGGEALSKQQAGPEAWVTVGSVSCRVLWVLLEEGRLAGAKHTPSDPPGPPSRLSLLFSEPGPSLGRRRQQQKEGGQGLWEPCRDQPREDQAGILLQKPDLRRPRPAASWGSS